MSPVILLSSSFLYNECCMGHRYTCKLECNCWFACQWKVNFQQNNNAVFILMKLNTFSNCIVLFQKISILPPQRVFWVWTPYPSGNSSLGWYLPLKILAFETPSPSEFPMNFCDGGIDFFWTHTLIQLNVSKGCNFTFKVKSFYAVDSFNSETSFTKFIA